MKTLQRSQMFETTCRVIHLDSFKCKHCIYNGKSQKALFNCGVVAILKLMSIVLKVRAFKKLSLIKSFMYYCQWDGVRSHYIRGFFYFVCLFLVKMLEFLTWLRFFLIKAIGTDIVVSYFDSNRAAKGGVM